MLKKLLSLTTALILSYSVSDISAVTAADEQKSIRIAVVSDLHYAPTPAEEDIENADKTSLSEKRMISEAERILNQTMKDILRTAPDSILISGDLTLNGEKKNAENLSVKLNDFSSELKGGIYVVNGNHDINNSHAVEFTNGEVIPAERMNTDEFRDIFRNFGYGENSRFFNGKAGDEVRNSGELSYVTEICDGVTLIVLDGGCYSNDKSRQYSAAQKTGGEISPELLEWAASESKAASEKGDLVLAMCHYSVIPHMDQNNKLTAAYSSNYVIPDWQKTAETLADAGTAAVFTGHYHGNDISSYTSKNGNTIYDIQTASIVNYPVNWRSIDITVTEKNGRKSYDIDVDTHFLHEAEGLDLVYNGNEYSDIQQYAFDKFGINKDTITGIADFFSREICYDIKHFDDDTYGNGLQGYLRRYIGAEDMSFGEGVSEKVKQIIAEKLPLETSLNLGDAVASDSDIKLNISAPDISDAVYTADIMLNYSCEIDEQLADVTERSKISLDFSILSSAIDRTIAELQEEIDKSEFTNYSSSDLKEDINKLLADVVNSVVALKVDGTSTAVEIINDAYSVKARGNETTEVDEVVRRMYGEDITPEEMNQKRAEWNKQFTDEEFIDEVVSTALDSVSDVAYNSDYHILSELMTEPFTEDQKPIIYFSDTEITATADGVEIETFSQMSLINSFLSYLLSFTTPAKMLDTAIFLQNGMGLLPKDVLSGYMSDFAQLYLAMTENYGENEDLYFSFEYTPLSAPSKEYKAANRQTKSENPQTQTNKTKSNTIYDCPDTGDGGLNGVWEVMSAALLTAFIAERNQRKNKGVSLRKGRHNV